MQDKVQAGGQMDIIAALGGSKGTVTSNPGDVAALNQVLAQLQGADYSALLQSIFQQAGAQIPGISQALAGTGMRTQGNSAMNAMLQKLLQQTAIEAQKQIAAQQLQNQQLQVQAGQAKAQTTQGTKKTEQAGMDLGRLTGVVGVLQGLKQLGVLDKLGLGTPAATPAATPAPAPVQATVQQSTATPSAMSFFAAPAPAPAPAMQAPQVPSFDLSALFTPQAPQYDPAISSIAPTYDPVADLMQYSPAVTYQWQI